MPAPVNTGAVPDSGSTKTVAVRASAVDSLATTIAARDHAIHADEPANLGGTDTGPTPVELLLGALAACTVITVRMYARRKQWDAGTITAETEGYTDQASRLVSAVVRVRFTGPLDEAQRTRLLEIAGKCPVHRTLVVGVPIEVRSA